MAEDIRYVSATLDAAEEATNWISPAYRNNVQEMDLGIEASSDFSGSIVLEKRFTIGTTDYTRTVETFTESAQKRIVDTVNGVKYRLRASEVSAGSVEAELYRDHN